MRTMCPSRGALGSYRFGGRYAPRLRDLRLGADAEMKAAYAVTYSGGATGIVADDDFAGGRFLGFANPSRCPCPR